MTMPMSVLCHTLSIKPTTEGNCPLNIMFDTFVLCDLRKNSWFPLGLENLKKWEGIFQSGKSHGILNRLEKSQKYWKTEAISNKYYLLFFSDI